jgi:small-conductance mechanosensitive channel
MAFKQALQSVRSVLDTSLLEVSGTTVTVGTALSALLVILATVWLSKLVRRGVRRLFARRGVQDESTVGTIAGLLHYAILASGFGVALQTIGIDLAALFAAGAIFAIGLGFAMQNIAQNFVAGVIVLVERAIKPGDILEVEGAVVRVSRLGIRATIVQTRDGEDLIVPNSVLAQSTVKNYTLEDSTYRLRTLVGVVYDSDMKKVRKVLSDAAHGLTWRDQDHEPQVLMLEFGDSSVVFEVAVWMGDPWRARPALSALNEAIWFAFQNVGITIAFPQLDVHFDPPVDAVLTRMGAA